MKLVFMGTPEWAIPSLQALLDSEHTVIAAYTQPDRLAGRKKKLLPSAVKVFAESQGLEVRTPEKASSLEVIELLKNEAPDLIFVCAYGQILSQKFLDVPRVGCFNLHFSLLPRWRGASPVQAAIAAGDEVTGVSLQKVVLKLDAGPLVCSSVPTEILAKDTTQSLGDRLAKTSQELVQQCLPNLLNNSMELTPQDRSQVTHCRIIKKNAGKVCWNKESAVEIERKCRAFTPWPGIYALDQKGKRLQFLEVEAETGELNAGEVDSEFRVGTGSGVLRIHRLKPEGKGAMEAKSFLRGHANFSLATN